MILVANIIKATRNYEREHSGQPMQCKVPDKVWTLVWDLCGGTSIAIAIEEESSG